MKPSRLTETTSPQYELICAGLGCILYVFTVIAVSQAQPALEISRVQMNWPDVEMYFSVSCGGTPSFNFSAQDLTLTDNGEARSFFLSCPDQNQHCPMSVALAFDAGDGMKGGDNTAAIAAGSRFIERMDGMTDEAAIVFFNDSVRVAQSMNSDRGLLAAAMNTLPATGGRRLWDGVRAGLDAIVADGGNTCRALVLLTDGIDLGSTNTPQTLIDIAVREQIRIFTIALGATTRVDELQLLADRSGGRLFHTSSSSNLTALYEQVAAHISWGFQECRLAYTADCADGQVHTVELTLNDHCGSAAADVASYAAPFDTSTYRDVRIGFERRSGYGGAVISVPIELRTPMSSSVLPPMMFTVKADAPCMQIVGATFAESDLWDTTLVSTRVTREGLRVSSSAGILVQGTGALMRVAVQLNDVADTTCCNLRITDMDFAFGCLAPALEEGDICVLPRRALLECDIVAPNEIRWNDTNDAYESDPFPVTLRVTNGGFEGAWNIRYRILYDSSAVTLANPKDAIQTGHPASVMPGDTSVVRWLLSPRLHSVQDSTIVCIETIADNAPTVRCCATVRIAAAQNDLHCALTLPTLTVDSVRQLYLPQPMLLTAAIRNTGNSSLRGVAAELELPPQLTLAGPDAPDSSRKELLPSFVRPQDSSMVSWQIEVAVPWPDSSLDVPVLVRAVANNGDSTETRMTLHVPALGFPFAFSLSVDGPLSMCDGDTRLLDAGAGYASYAWSTGDTVRSIAVTGSGSYYCSVTDSSGRRGESDTLVLQLRPRPTPTIEVLGSHPFCEGDSVVLRMTKAYPFWLWNTGARTRDIVVSRPGAYVVTVEDSAGCSASSDTLLVRMHPAAVRPDIARAGDVLTSSRAAKYQWLRSNTVIPGATNQFFTLSRSGSYTVRIIDQNGCEAEARPFVVDVLHVRDLPAAVAAMDVYPNPATGSTVLFLQLSEARHVHLALLDLLGRCVWRYEALVGTVGLRLTVPLAGLSPGIYILRLRMSDVQVLRRLQVQQRR